MANYKSIVDIESVAEATESMNVLVEDAGSLKKVPAGGMIGGSGSGKMLVINYKAQPAPVGLDTLPTQVYTANMTYAEFSEAVMSGEFTGGILCQINSDTNYFYYYRLEELNMYNYPTLIMYFYNRDQGSLSLCFNEDNSITEQATAS